LNEIYVPASHAGTKDNDQNLEVAVLIKFDVSSSTISISSRSSVGKLADELPNMDHN